VLRAAVGLADDAGIAALTMRRLAQELGVEAMSLYHHVADKNEVLDGMAEVVLSDINDRVNQIAGPSGDWKPVVRRRILAAREVLLDHPWAPALLESRASMSAGAMRYFDTLSGLLRQGGFSADLVHHSLHALGSRALGFTQELFGADSNGDTADADESGALMAQQMADEYPHLTEIVMQAMHDADSTLGWCDDQTEFEFGLDLILDGLERLRDTTS
jgi:AcrR family transcriptional regulator